MDDYFNDIVRAIYNLVCYTFKIDLTTGLVDTDIIDKEGFNFTTTLGLKAPCAFDDLVKNSFNKDFIDAEYTYESNIKNISTKTLKEAYLNGLHEVEATIHWKTFDKYHRLVYLLDKEKKTDHIIAFALATDVTEIEVERNKNSKSAQCELAETSDIIASANIGIWELVLKNNESPKMKASPKMLELLGLDPNSKYSGDFAYNQWLSRVKNSARPQIDECIKNMISRGKDEVTYLWNHPTKGDIYIRCGGTAHTIQGGTSLRGYHYDVTEYVSTDIKYKQLLQDSLLEAENQKKLLQEALDNYKQADYDRRTDFLTGLRNRQDMFKFLQEALSGKNHEIRAMFMMDIDNFKKLNDYYGHLYGDECLHAIGAALIEYGEENNIYFYRYGGEEILGIALAGEKDTAIIAEELVQLIASLKLGRDDVDLKIVTISLGYTTDNSRYEKMIDKADKAMYFAKRAGKNRTAKFENLPKDASD